MIESIVKKTGAPVSVAICVDTALDALREQRIDIMLSDFKLKGFGTAADVVREARQYSPRFAILISGKHFSRPPRGFDVVLAKPVFEFDIKQAMRFVWSKTESEQGR